METPQDMTLDELKELLARDRTLWKSLTLKKTSHHTYGDSGNNRKLELYLF